MGKSLFMEMIILTGRVVERSKIGIGLIVRHVVRMCSYLSAKSGDRGFFFCLALIRGQGDRLT